MSEPIANENPTPSPVEPPPAPPAPPAAPAKPTRRAAFDAEIERQLEEAMAGMDAKALHGDAGAGRKKHAPPPDQGKKRGRVVAWHADDVFLDVGGRSQGVLPLVQFPEGRPAVGTEVDVYITGYDRANGLLLLAREGQAEHIDWSSVQEGQMVEARVTGTNKGGLEVVVNGIRGFLPVSHLELFRVEDMQPYLNQRLNCLVTDVNPAERNLVVSRRALLEKERAAAREKLWAELAEGQVRTGTVRHVREFGAFIDLGGVDGLLHISEMAWSRVDKADSVVQPGQQVQVQVLKIDHEKKKVSLGLKQLQESPWNRLDAKYPPGEIVTGKVTKLMDFGAFVELEPGIEGLVHISELSHQRVRKPADVVKPGQEVQVRVLKVEPSVKRISLSLKAATTAPEPPPEAAATQPEKPKKTPPPRKAPLKGGLG
jgi:small subunit ribosomal protein S1